MSGKEGTKRKERKREERREEKRRDIEEEKNKLCGNRK